MSEARKSALLIAGPTASGKSALALKLARERGGIIINADSMQVYSELRILSARPTPQDEAEAEHRLYGHVSGAEDYSTGKWLLEASREIERAWSQNRLPIICGGTGLYFRALLHGLASVPPIASDVREKWRAFDGDLHAELLKRDAAAAARLHPSDHQRLRRALEVQEGTGKSLLQWQNDAQSNAILSTNQVEKTLMHVPRGELYARAEQRFDLMLSHGALEEVRNLPTLGPELPVMKAIGVPELLAHLRGEIRLEQAASQAKTATRNYIKRQLTWMRNQMSDWESIAN